MKVYAPSTLLRERAKLATLARKMRRMRPFVGSSDPFSLYGRRLRLELRNLEAQFGELERKHMAHGGEAYSSASEEGSLVKRHLPTLYELGYDGSDTQEGTSDEA